MINRGIFSHICPIEIQDGWASLNVAFRPVGKPTLRDDQCFEILTRVVEENPNQNPKAINRISKAIISLNGKVVEYNPYFLTPNNGSYAYEDPRIQDELITFNELVFNRSRWEPRPAIYKRFDDGAVRRVGFGPSNSKVMVFLGDNYFLNRPQDPFDQDRPSVVLGEIIKSDKENIAKKTIYHRTIFGPEEDMALSGLSTPFVNIAEGRLFFCHQVTSLEASKKQYLQYAVILSHTNPPEVIARSKHPIFTREMFPRCNDSWIRGAVYIDNICLDCSGKYLISIPSIDDRDKYIVVLKLQDILNLC